MYSKSLDSRTAALAEWLSNGLGLEVDSLKPASSDASFRRYFRVKHAQGCHVVMDAPPDKENTEPFIRVAALLSSADIHVPAIYQQNLLQGFLVLEDLGSHCFLDQLQTDTADALYSSAMDSLFKLQTRINPLTSQLPRYDQALLQRELGIFDEWFLDKLLGVVLPDAIKQPFHQLLIDSALQQPQVCVHRDFHSRNLMVLATDSPGVIDFQDAVIGPISYDLVSLLRDCYISWPQAQIDGWVKTYYLRLQQAGLLTVELPQFQQWFDWMGLQRHLKAIGIFSRLHLRDNKSGYLADIPRTLAYVQQVTAHYPQLQAFNQFVQQSILPNYQTKL